MNYSDITTIAETLQKRYEQLDKELHDHKENAIQELGGYDVFNGMKTDKKRELVYNEEWHRILDERDAVYSAFEHFKEYRF